MKNSYKLHKQEGKPRWIAALPTCHLRRVVDNKHIGFPYVPVDVGDVIFILSRGFDSGHEHPEHRPVDDVMIKRRYVYCMITHIDSALSYDYTYVSWRIWIQKVQRWYYRSRWMGHWMVWKLKSWIYS